MRALSRSPASYLTILSRTLSAIDIAPPDKTNNLLCRARAEHLYVEQPGPPPLGSWFIAPVRLTKSVRTVGGRDNPPDLPSGLRFGWSRCGGCEMYYQHPSR